MEPISWKIRAKRARVPGVLVQYDDVLIGGQRLTGTALSANRTRREWKAC